MNDKLECASVSQSHGGEVPNVARGETTDAEVFSQHDDGRINEAEPKIAISPVGDHRARELIDRRRGVGKRPTRKVVDERVHGWTLVAKEVIDFRHDQPWDVPRARSIDDVSETQVVRRIFDEVVEQRTRVADQCCGTSDRHQRARPRSRARAANG